MSRADTVAVGDGGESLDVPADEPADRLCFCLAQRRELLGDVLDRAVVLADLHTDAPLVHGGGVTVGAEGVGERSGPLGQRQRRELRCVARLPLADPLTGELLHRLLPRGVPQVAQGLHRDRVVRRGAGTGVPGIRQREQARRSATAARAADRGHAGHDRAVSEHPVEMPPDGGRGHSQPLAERRDRGGPELEQQAGHPLAGASVRERGRRGVFHNDIVA